MSVVTRRECHERKAGEFAECSIIASSRATVKSYSQQFSQIYFCRLKELLQPLRASAHAKWASARQEGSPTFVDRILELTTGSDSVVFGTIYVHCSNKPNVLKDLEGDLDIPEIAVPESYLGGEEQYFIEDESGRLELRIPAELVRAAGLATGMCVALRGCEEESGCFCVSGYCMPGLAPALPRKAPASRNFVVFASDLGIGSDDSADVGVNLLFDLLTGSLPVSRLEADDISSFVIVGNCLSTPTKGDGQQKNKRGSERSKYYLEPLKGLDRRLAVAAQSIPITIIPGAADLTNQAIPQAPIKPGLLPNSSRLGSLRLLGNPCSVEISGTTFLLSSGQNVDDMVRYLHGADRMKAAETCLKARHVAPSAPDTLWCYPFFEEDPFILKNSPHCFVVGNQPSFATTMVTDDSGKGPGVRVILVPSFKDTRSIALLDLATMECRQVSLA